MQVLDQFNGKGWTLYNGDCCEVIQGLPEASVDFCVHSPPFSNLYIYSDSEADMGNSVDDAEFIEHYKFLIAELLRVTVTGRLCAVHCKDLPKYANRDDTAGLKDFPGDIIRAFIACGWSYHSRVTIWKCPVTERERTNNNGLLHKTVLRDRSQLRQGMADYLLLFRKAPEGTLMSDKPIISETERIRYNEDGLTIRETVWQGFTEYVGPSEMDPRMTDDHPSKFSRKRRHGTLEHKSSIEIWRRYAEPVWWDIDQTNVLNCARKSKGEKDERHICPLQLDVIERAIDIWSMPGEVVLSPFAGIGSEGVGALRRGRKFIGIELKAEYCANAVKELQLAENYRETPTLFDIEEA